MDIKIPNLKNLRSTELAGAVLNAGFRIPTLEMATKRAERLCGALSINAGERLPLCYGGHCGLLSCPPCRWQEQQFSMIRLLKLVNARGGKRAWRTLNIVPEYGKTPIGELPNGGLRGFRDQTRAAIRKIDSEAVAVLCVDISWERSAGQEEYWQWHLHGLMLKPEVKTLKQIHKRFAWKDKAGLKASCYRPVHTKKIDELVGWLAYMSKPQFFLREQRPDAQGNLVPKKGKMTIERELEFVKALSKLKAKQRVFFIGMDPL